MREEIEFTENYLALEQCRFRGRFRYVIRVQPYVAQNAEVPKMASPFFDLYHRITVVTVQTFINSSQRERKTFTIVRSKDKSTQGIILIFYNFVSLQKQDERNYFLC